MSDQRAGLSEAILVGLDYEFSPACEHSQHDHNSGQHSGPAYVLVRLLPCPVCGYGITSFYLCKSFWLRSNPIVCECGHPRVREEAYELISYVDKGD